MTDNKLNHTETKEEGFNIKDEIFKYLHFWKWFLLSVIVFVTLTYFYLKTKQPIYNTEAQIQIIDPSGGLELPTSSFVFKRSNINLANDNYILKSYPIIEKVVTNLNLNYEFYLVGNIKNSLLETFPVPLQYKDTLSPKDYGSYAISFNDSGMTIVKDESKTYTFKSYNTENHPEIPFAFDCPSHLKEFVNDKDYLIKIASVANTTIQTKNKIQITQRNVDSDVLFLALSGENRKISANVLNMVMEVYKNQGIEERQRVSKATMEFIDKRFINLRKELDSVEKGLETFKINNRLVDVETNSKLNLDLYTETEKQTFELELELERAKYVKETLSDRSDTLVKYIPDNLIDNDLFEKEVNIYNSYINKYNSLSLETGKNNPSRILALNELNASEASLKKTLNGYINSLKLDLSKRKRRKGNFNKKTSEFSNLEKEFRSINRQQNIKESLYIFLLKKREESAINIAITEPSVKIVEQALSIGGPIAPRYRLMYIIAVLVGLIIPFGIIYLIFFLDNKIHSKDDISKLCPNIPVLAEIPFIKDKTNFLIDNPNSHSTFAESFRILSSNLNFILPQGEKDKGKIILSTSTIKGEGKTFVSVNLSLALSSMNKKVLLIGADLRNPQIHTNLGKDKNMDGLSNYLYDSSYNWRDAIIKGFEKHNHHHIILSGSIPPNPTHLLTNGRFEQLLEEARQEYDYVVVDTAPTILVTDTLLISKYADATVFVVRANFTDKKLLNFSRELSHTGKIKNMAYTINSVGERKGYGYGYGYSYGYNYGYGYGYNSDEN